MFRLLRLLPVLIPLVTAALRNAKVRSLLHLKPLDATHRGPGKR